MRLQNYTRLDHWQTQGIGLVLAVSPKWPSFLTVTPKWPLLWCSVVKCPRHPVSEGVADATGIMTSGALASAPVSSRCAHCSADVNPHRCAGVQQESWVHTAPGHQNTRLPGK